MVHEIIVQFGCAVKASVLLVVLEHWACSVQRDWSRVNKGLSVCALELVPLTLAREADTLLETLVIPEMFGLQTNQRECCNSQHTSNLLPATNQPYSSVSDQVCR